MATHDQSIEVYGSLRAVYKQWTQFETYRYFMDGVRSVARTGEGMTHWVVDDDDGRKREFDAAVSEDEANHRVTWSATSGSTFAGVATVYPIDERTSRVRLETDDGAGVAPAAATLPGEGRQAEGDLDRFKRYFEASGDETGAWQGFVGGQPT